jgi:hypothetical protein
MTPSPLEQRNPYKGGPPRGWIRVGLVDPAGVVEGVDLLADTGSPFLVIIGLARLQRFLFTPAPSLATNYGRLRGGRIRVVIPALAFDRIILGHGSDAVITDVRKSHPDFAGLVGLPFLRLMRYGGDADWFWIRPAGAASP